jgi:hypothetical protein
MNSGSGRERVLGVRLLQIAVVYLVVGMLGGIYMGITHQLQYGPVHAHMNLLGWATLAIAGLAYQVYPELARHWLARWHAWLHNVGLVLMTVGMFGMFSGRMEMFPLAVAGSITAMVGVLLFAVNLCGRLGIRAAHITRPSQTVAAGYFPKETVNYESG